MSQHRVLLIEHQAHLCIDLGRLVIRRTGQDDVFILPADIAVLCLHHPAITLSAQALQTLSGEGAVVLLTDSKHQPLAQVYPLLAPMRQTLRLFQQWQLDGHALRGVIWQQLIRGRLLGEAAVLKALGQKGHLYLQRLADKVMPADESQCEGQGARHYWKHLFTERFIRAKQGADDAINSRLNFGYAVLRSMIARSLACAGLNGSLGMGHRNMQNPFNLADDLIEPYRFIVEWQVARDMPLTSGQPFDGAARKALLQVLTLEIPLPDGSYRLTSAIDATVDSLVRVLEALDAGKPHQPLVLPEYDAWASMAGA